MVGDCEEVRRSCGSSAERDLPHNEDSHERPDDEAVSCGPSAESSAGDRAEGDPASFSEKRETESLSLFAEASACSCGRRSAFLRFGVA